MRAASSPAASSAVLHGDGFFADPAGDFVAVLARHMAVRKAGEKRHIGRRRPATCRSRRETSAASSAGSPIPNTSSKRVTYWRAILSRSAASRIASSRPTFGGSRTSCARPNRGRPGKPARSPRTQRPRRPCPSRQGQRRDFRADRRSHFGGARQRRGEKHDAEIGVGADRLARGADGLENASPDRQVGIGERPGRDTRAGEELLGRHAVAIGEEMDIARLQRLDLQPAGFFIGGPDVLPRQRHLRSLPARSKRYGRVPMRRRRHGRSGISAAHRRSHRRCSPRRPIAVPTRPACC